MARDRPWQRQRGQDGPTQSHMRVDSATLCDDRKMALPRAGLHRDDVPCLKSATADAAKSVVVKESADDAIMVTAQSVAVRNIERAVTPGNGMRDKADAVQANIDGPTMQPKWRSKDSECTIGNVCL